MATISWSHDPNDRPDPAEEAELPAADAPAEERELPVADVLPEDRVRREPGASATSTPRIWAVGGGKGGVGKSVVTTNLAAAMAGAGRRCAVIDVDLGAANLHSLMGVPRPRHSLSQLLTGDVDSLAELLVQTSVPNLWIVSGHQALLDMANPRPSDKERLFREIRELDVDEIFLDLGAGSAFDVLDFFLLARRGIVVVTPEPTSVENAEHFVRAAFYRSLRDVARRPDVASAIRRLRDDGHPRRIRSAGELIALVRAIDPPAAKPLEERAETFRPWLVLNQVRHPEQRSVASRLLATCRERLGADVELAGMLDADANVLEAVTRGQPAIQAFPLSRFSRQVGSLAERFMWGGASAADPPDEGGATHRPQASSPVPRFSALATEPRARVVPPSPALPAFDPDAPGAWLRRCREAQGWSLAELVERTRIRILEDIEQERFEVLPPEPYLKGYLLEYARELEVPDATALVSAYLHRCHAPDAEASPAAPAPGSAGSPAASSGTRSARLRRLRSWRG